MTKFISWNVNGLRACNGKGFSEAFKALDADFFCLQETKMQAGQLDLQFEGYKSYWSYADKKGYSGTAIYTRHDPLAVSYGLGIDEHDHEGRVITLEMPEYFVVTAYVPNSQDGLRRLDYRMKWDEDFRNYLMELRKKKPVIACGDFNVAHQEIDLKNPKSNRRNAGFTDEEREQFSNLLNAGFTDTFRFFHPDETGIYSWWSYRFKAREKNAGWRIDYFIVSDNLNDQLADAKIHTEIFGSDHCPVEVVLKYQREETARTLETSAGNGLTPASPHLFLQASPPHSDRHQPDRHQLNPIEYNENVFQASAGRCGRHADCFCLHLPDGIYHAGRHAECGRQQTGHQRWKCFTH